MSRHDESRGQVLVLVAGAMLTLLAVGALVVDLGFSWMLHRHEQNAADSGALAAARWIGDFRTTGDAKYGPSGPGGGPAGLMWKEACSQAIENGFFPGAGGNPSGCLPANDGERAATLVVNYPPVGDSAGSFAGRSGFVQVVISGQHASFFGRVIGQDQATVVSSAVAANSDGDSNPYSLVALDTTATCGTGKIGGNSNPNLKVNVAGAVHVNSTCASGTPNSTCSISGNGGLTIGGGGQLGATGKVYVAGTCKADPSSLVGTLVEGAIQLGDPLAELAPPTATAVAICPTTGAPATTQCELKNGSYTLQPGIYRGGWKITGPSTTVTLSPGVYIISGGGIKQTNGALSAASGNILIYSTDDPACPTNNAFCQGSIDLTGGSLSLSGITSGPYKGMVIWQDGNGSCATLACPVSLEGSTALNIGGTIYAPKQLVSLAGGSSGTGTAAVQIISWQWKITGDANLLLPYDPNQLYHLDQRGLVH